jgi:hypothetical protein
MMLYQGETESGQPTPSSKELIYKLDPELATIWGDSEEVRIKFMKLIKRAWEELG